MSQAKRLKELEKENSHLKKVVADLSVDKLILQESFRENSLPQVQEAPRLGSGFQAEWVGG